MQHKSNIVARPGWTAVLVDRDGEVAYRDVIAWQDGPRGLRPLTLRHSYNCGDRFDIIAVIGPDGSVQEYDGEHRWRDDIAFGNHLHGITERRRKRAAVRYAQEAAK